MFNQRFLELAKIVAKTKDEELSYVEELDEWESPSSIELHNLLLESCTGHAEIQRYENWEEYLEEYIGESEHGDGWEYWAGFASLDEFFEDFLLGLRLEQELD